MHLPIPINVAHYPRSVVWYMVVAWVLIVVKCVAVWWAIAHWSVPVHPLWIVAPTIAFAALATVLWLTHHED